MIREATYCLEVADLQYLDNWEDTIRLGHKLCNQLSAKIEQRKRTTEGQAHLSQRPSLPVLARLEQFLVGIRRLMHIFTSASPQFARLEAIEADTCKAIKILTPAPNGHPLTARRIHVGHQSCLIVGNISNRDFQTSISLLNKSRWSRRYGLGNVLGNNQKHAQ